MNHAVVAACAYGWIFYNEHVTSSLSGNERYQKSFWNNSKDGRVSEGCVCRRKIIFCNMWKPAVDLNQPVQQAKCN